MNKFLCSTNYELVSYLDPITGKLNFNDPDPVAVERAAEGSRVFNRSWVPFSRTITEIAAAVKSGWGLFGGVLKGNIRTEGTEIESVQLLILDVDGVAQPNTKEKLPPPTVQEFLETNIAKHSCLVYHSPSSTIYHNRYRVVFALQESITDVEFATYIVKVLAKRVTGCDVAASHCKQLYYGCHPNPQISHDKPLEQVCRVDDVVLPKTLIDSCYSLYQRDKAKKVEQAASLDFMLSGRYARPVEQAQIDLSDIISSNVKAYTKDISDHEVSLLDPDNIKSSCDRSETLWKVIQEVLGWSNFLDSEDITYHPSPRHLVINALKNLYPVEYESGKHLDKLRRVIGNNNLAHCAPSVAYYGIHSVYAQICRKCPEYIDTVEQKYPDLVDSVKEELRGQHSNVDIVRVSANALSRLLGYQKNDILDSGSDNTTPRRNSQYDQTTAGSISRDSRTDYDSSVGNVNMPNMDNDFSDDMDSTADNNRSDSDRDSSSASSIGKNKRKARQKQVREQQEAVKRSYQQRVVKK